MREKVLVTGGAGFIGARLCEKLLLLGYEVHVFDLIPLEKSKRLQKIKEDQNFFYTQGDLRNKEKIESWYLEEATTLFHLASVVGVENYINDPLSLIDIVISGTRYLLELATHFKTRVLFTSTSEVYGKNENTPWKENDDRLLGATSVDRWSYSTSKAVCEHMLFALNRSKGLKFTTVRFFNIYGPGQAPIFVASKSLYQAMNNKPPLIYDSGKQTRCFTYVDDALEAVVIASQKEEAIAEVFNIGSNIETSMEDVVKICIEASGNNLNPAYFNTKKEYGDSYEDIGRRIPNVEKAKNILGWRATTSLKDGINKNVKWINHNKWWLE